MKALALKTYALLVLGMVPAIRHVVAAGIGLGVYINPKVDHKNGRLLLESIVLDEKYAVSISSCSSMLEKVAVTTKQKLKPLSKAFSKLKGFASRSRYNHSSRSGDEAGPSESLMHNSYLSTEHSRQVSEYKNELWELPFSSKAVMVGFHSYTAHWEMNGGSLIRWIQSELLYASDSKIMMNGQAYVKKHQGVYAYKWTAKQGYVINFGPPEITLVDLVEIEQDELLGVMFAGNIVRKRVRIDFDIEAIRIPSSYYETVESIFLKHGFATVSNGNERAQFRGDRSNFNSLQKNSNSIHI
ncbi:unnamed protein product [Albugo candida]|uniref:Uncharacterized protein n=1 Tax=Albugo candida TaxID=65357 RepID=A0A024G998_9STRA|nr:unnamed protein product [Albugo candida]|eukprot:CCI43135.1 unnamed protein product [Albugo candida]